MSISDDKDIITYLTNGLQVSVTQYKAIAKQADSMVEFFQATGPIGKVFFFFLLNYVIIFATALLDL